jgi:membrane associated rhomboid family serine protease
MGSSEALQSEALDSFNSICRRIWIEVAAFFVAWFGARQFLHDLIAVQDEPRPQLKGCYPRLPPGAPLTAHLKARMIKPDHCVSSRPPCRSISSVAQDNDCKPEEPEAESSLVRFSFRPGPYGFKGDKATGLVTEVAKDLQGDQHGIRVGWQCLKIDGQPFIAQLLDYKSKGSANYVVTFLKDASAAVTFRPGRLGLVGNWICHGDVVEVTKNGQAESSGVQVGWKFLKVDGQKFTEQLLDARIGGKQDFVITFLKEFAAVPPKTEELLTWQVFPSFVIFQIVMAIVVHAVTTHLDLGIHSHNTDSSWANFRLHGTNCEDYRTEVWRWLTHQFLHADWVHVISNCIAMIFLGIPMEGYQGTLRIAIMFNVGILGGGVGHLLFNAHLPLVGFSGGVMAIFGMHISDLAINWRYSIYLSSKLVILFILAILIWIPAFIDVEDSRTSHACHFGGWIAGMCIGALLGRNFVPLMWERILQAAICFTGGVVLTIVIIWLAHWPPRTVMDATQWCWAAQVYNPSLFQNQGWNCVACADTSCIDSWMSNQQYIVVGGRHHWRIASDCGIYEPWRSGGGDWTSATWG